MNYQNIIGIDPDSIGFEMAFFKNGNHSKPTRKYFSISQEGLTKFLELIKKVPDVIIAIEGSQGHSLPIEKLLRNRNQVFYSFKPSSVNEFRKSVLGQNKNNKIDAEATARYAISLAAQGLLEKYRRVWFPDETLQVLTRLHSKRTKQKTAEINDLWKFLHAISPDLYLALQKENINNGLIQSKSILSLFKNLPDIGKWKELNDSELLQQMETRGSLTILETIKNVANTISKIPIGYQNILTHSAARILGLKNELKSIEQLIEQNVHDDDFVKLFTGMKGIGILTAAKMKAEMIDVRRFFNDDHLASYAGLCLKDKSTGNSKCARNSIFFNHRLKDIFMTAVKNYIRFNPDNHLSGYYRNLIKHKKMKVTEARKRAARAFARTIYKLWKSIIELKYLNKTHKKGSMAIGRSPEYTNTISNILPSNVKFKKKEGTNQGKKRKKVLT